MYRKILATAVTMFLLMTSLAYAVNMQVNSSAVPVSGGTITPNGIKFFGPASTDATRTYTVAPKAGWALTNVQIDGVPATAPYVVPFDTSRIHTIKANFSQATTTFSLTATAGAGGTAIITGGGATSIKSTDSRKVVVGPNTGYQIATLTVDGNPIAAAVGSKTAYTVDFTPFGATNHTVSATFTLSAASVTVYPGGAQTVASGATVTLSGKVTVTANMAPSAAQFNLTSGTATISAATIGAPTVQFGNYVYPVTATATGATATFSVNLQATVGGTVVTSPNTPPQTRDALITVVAPGVANPASKPCITCHAGSGPVLGYPAGVHAAQNVSCAGCHAATHPDNNPNCATCHFEGLVAYTNFPAVGAPTSICAPCHVSTFIHDAQAATPLSLGTDACAPACHVAKTHKPTSQSCIACHNVAVALHPDGDRVNDNSGVRAITPEFEKRSHHITGGTPHDEQCVVCHLEGKLVGSNIVIDGNYHMKDNKIYLRNADSDAAFEWSGTEHTNMDNFCFSCHDSDGATSAGINAFMAGKNYGGPFSAKNPFADTLTNGYDQIARAGVVDVKTAFTTTNASHHAVSGQRYKYRFSTQANAAAWAARTGNPVPPASEIAEGHTAADGSAIEWTGLTYDPLGPEEGGEATLFEGGKFVSTYVPLGASLNVGDNSTLHCGDCHTVGQWKPGSSTFAGDGVTGPGTTTVAIGAHGSANDYLLRNSLGTDALHNQLTYVCFNCHAASTQAATEAAWAEQVAESLIADSVAPASGSALNPLGKYIPAPVPTWKAGWNALHPTVFPGQMTGYWTAHSVSAMHIQCQADSADNITSVPDKGFANFSSDRLQKSWRPEQVKAYDFVPAPGATAVAPAGGSNAASGNITGIACTNCHNSGLRSAFGGIHGGSNIYTDGLGRMQKSYRFMPGMGNYRYAPPGGWDGKDVSDPTLLTINNPLYPGTPGNRNDQAVGYPGPSGKPMGGCYTNGGTGGPGSDLNNSGGVTYGVCNHHGTSTAASADPAGRPPTFRATYGGGTTGNPTTFEPTVREATAGGTLVTRPLQY